MEVNALIQCVGQAKHYMVQSQTKSYLNKNIFKKC